MQLQKGTIKYAAGPPRTTKYGDRINVVATLPDGEEFKLWGDPGDPVLTPLRKGQTISVIHDGKGYRLLDESPPIPQPRPQDWETPAPAAMSPAIAPSAIDKDVAELINIFCQIKSALRNCDEATCRSLAATIYEQRYKSGKSGF